MQDRHLNRQKYFDEQVQTTRRYVIRYVSPFLNLGDDTHVLEVGCGEGGNLLPFLERGCKVTGIDLSESKITLGREIYAGHPKSSRLSLLCENIYDVDPSAIQKADLIFLRDVIEHIPNQERFMDYIKRFLKPGGKLFFGFPPWQMPFGGHQQVCSSKFLSFLPYFHLLPAPVYTFILRSFGETQRKIDGLLEIKETGISIDRFKRILHAEGYRIERETFYLFNPNYETKFNIKPREQYGLISSIPFFRNFITSCYYCVLSVD